MIIGIPKETHPVENRVALLPKHVEKLIKKGFDIIVESDLGAPLGIPDSEYAGKGAKVSPNKAEVLSCDVIFKIRKLDMEDVALLKNDALLLSYLNPFQEKELIDALAARQIKSVSLEMIPRTTRAQKMDVLSSQANLAGYAAVVLAASRLPKALPMMMTPAGTISPAKVFIIGAGVAGLQAIATAKRLGARVEAFDTRPVVAEQVQSLGAKFLKIDLGETGQTAGGYAKELTPEQVAKQKQGMVKACASSQIIITTAQVFGRKAPVLITEDMISQMTPGSIIVDMAVDTGGNVEGSKPDQEVLIHGVRVIGVANLPGLVAMDASDMFASNLCNFILEFWNEKELSLTIDPSDEIIKGCLITEGGSIVHPQFIAKHEN